ncbi:uncharacterized protein LOC141664546 [Apium graveolens]|uniref:uncharacterized protein LOC141664546 n=1 Tax=Apium graveolens TaxID=4045 RepID=UPI003D7B1B10
MTVSEKGITYAARAANEQSPTAAKSSLVILTASSVTTAVTLASSPSITPSLSQVATLPLAPTPFYLQLLVKMGELCGTSVSLRCQLPMEDLDALVSVTCDEDLSNLMEEYDKAESSSMKIRAFLLLHKTASAPPSNDVSTSPKSPPNMHIAGNGCCNSRVSPVYSAKRCTHHNSKAAARVTVNPGRIQNGNQW